MPSQEQDLSYFNLCAYLLLLFLQKHELQFSVWFENTVSYKPSFNKFYQVYEGSFNVAKTTQSKVFTRFSGSLVGQVANKLAFMEEWLVKYYPLLRVSLTLSLQERKGWLSGESTRLPPMWSSFKSRRRRPGLGLLLVLSFAPGGFSPGSPVFTCPQKPTFPNSNSL